MKLILILRSEDKQTADWPCEEIRINRGKLKTRPKRSKRSVPKNAKHSVPETFRSVPKMFVLFPKRFVPSSKRSVSCKPFSVPVV